MHLWSIKRKVGHDGIHANSDFESSRLNLISEVVDTPDDLLPVALRIAQSLTYNNVDAVRALKVSIKEVYAMTVGNAVVRQLKSNEDCLLVLTVMRLEC